MSDIRDYWVKKLAGYAKESWANQPTLFAQEAIKYFPAEGDLLELGSGLSQDSAWFASKGYKVTATDQIDLPKMPGIKTAMVDMSKPLPFRPGSFDVVYAHLSVHYFTKQRTQQMFDEIYKILRPGGVFAFLVNSVNDPELTEGEEIEENYRKIGPLNKRFFDLRIARELTHRFKPLVLDDKGSSHKDKAVGVINLVRFIGIK